nr:C10 family peptidase [Bacteroidales bacterium]
MRKSLLLTACLVAVVSVLISAPVDTLTGLRVASNFYRERAGVQQSRSISSHLVKTYKILPSEARDSLNCLYIYNVGDGYVIVSADDRITPVLGYSTESNFDAQHIPVQLQEWLSQYAAKIGAAVSSPAFTNEQVNTSWRALASDNYTPSRYGTVRVAPLIQTLWDQYPYYNNYCPYNTTANQRTVTGCVATAMAQLIRYWQYPPQGIGSHSYNHLTYGTQSANFGNTTYNYSLMPLSLNGSSSTAEINEVAKLMYHCGVSVDMGYGLLSDGGSGASTRDAANAFNTYFGYSGCQYESKSDYTDYQWKNKLKTELNNGRPVLYDGSGTGGHAFICDGYTVDDYFHFNFGWSGSYNGYFTLDDITPGSYNFNYTQGGIFNLSAASSILRPSVTELFYLIEGGTTSEGKKVRVITHHLSNPISITTSSPFSVSTDSVHYSSSVSLPTGGGTFYVRYQPAAGIHVDTNSIVTVSSGSLTENISLKGYTYAINCLPVNNLSITSSDLEHIHLGWTAPQIDTTPQTLSWNTGVYSNSTSIRDNKVTLLHRFTPTDLVPQHNKTLTSISFFVNRGVTVLKAVVYEGGDYSGSSFNPGTLILEQNIPISSLSENSWNTFTLSSPVTIDAHQELCFGVYMESVDSFPVRYGYPQVTKKGAIFGYENGGNTYWNQFNGCSWPIRGTIRNTQNVTHYEVSRDGTVLGTTTGTTYNDLVSHTDTYHYTVTAHWDNGCSADASLDFTNVASITATPQMLDFHNNYGYSNTIKTVQVNGNGISQPIQVSVSGNFTISTNGTSFSTSATLTSAGGTLYVKYAPTSASTSLETGQINITTGTLSTSVTLYGQCYDECLPPENLTLSCSGSTVNLSWSTPTVSPAAPSTLSWCTNMSSVRWGSGTKATMVHRYEPSDLTQHSNRALTAISFATYNTSTVTKCKVVVYKGGSYTGSTYNAGTLVYEQEIPLSSLSSSEWTWNTIALTTPVPIDITQELWFGVYMEYSGTLYYLAHNGTTIVPNKSNIYSTNNGNSWQNYNSGSYCLKATVEDIPMTVDHYQIDRNGSTVVTNTSSTHYSDNTSHNGTYNYTVWAIWSNGCQASASGSVSVTGICEVPGTSTTRSECGSYTWTAGNGQTYTTSGTYFNTHTLSTGCIQVDTLHLTIKPIPVVTISGNTNIHRYESTTLTASGASSYVWSTGAHNSAITVAPASTTTYSVIGTTNGCSSAPASVTVTVGDCIPAQGVETVTACGSYTWHGHTYTASTNTPTYTIPNGAASGCDSIVTLHLTIKPIPVVTISGNTNIHRYESTTLTAS